jgi:hypothetical protein
VRYAAAYTQQQLERVTTGRPTNSPGWGMLVACKTGAYVSERNSADHTTIEAGSTHVCRDYWLARERPELFKPADSRDTRTFREHRANLERARQKLERMPIRQASRHKGVLAHKGVLPTPPGRQHQGVEAAMTRGGYPFSGTNPMPKTALSTISPPDFR